MQVNFKVDTRELEDNLYLLAKAARVTPGVVIKEETKYIVKNIMQLTPPNNLAQGRKRITGDLSRVVYALDPARTQWAPLKAAITKGDTAKLTALLKNKRPPNFDFTTDSSRISAQHLKLRNNYGRVGRGVKPVIAALVKDVKRYTADIQSRVGWAKAGFVSALQAAGGTAPGWVSRHAAAAGTSVANFGENPSILAVANNIKIPNFQRVVDGAVNNRIRVTQTKIDRLVSGKAVNLGFASIPATD